MSIEQQNRIIAGFMGLELHGNDYHIYGRDITVHENRFPQALRYHSSWDWLMPVVEKIEHTWLTGYKYTHDDKPASFRVAIFLRCCDICVANSTGDNIIEITAAS